tara:strand:+ start:130 stop:555 length:426 start_codon:yes stop_codon:yes gene_type:complete
MILKFFDKDDLSNDNDQLINIACLMIHAAKIDENYTEMEKKIIKSTLEKLNSNNEEVEKLLAEAEKKEADSNHIQEFTKNIKTMNTENKKEIIKNVWTIILSDGNSDMYEENLIRRLAGLLYIDNKTMGDIKLDILKKIEK